MDDIVSLGQQPRPRRVSFTAEIGANAGLQDGEMTEMHPGRETHGGSDKPGDAGRGADRRNSAPQVVHQRHLPKEPAKFHIPRKNKEKRALFQYVPMESREYEDMANILTSSYIDTSSIGSFTYNSPRLIHSELLEKEFVEKRKEMKTEGRTDKELEESYCFMLADTAKLPWLCEKGLSVGQSWISGLGNPKKGVYLSRYSDLLQANPIAVGATGEILILKVMKGKVKSIYENMKSALDPTPRFDSHISKNASKVTSLTSYRAFELTQQYFYEYSFDNLRDRPRQVCPYAVVSFHFKGKDSPIPSKPLAPVRLNSQSTENRKEQAHFTVWTGDLVKGERILYQISLRSSAPPFLPHKLPEKLEIGWLMRLEQVTELLPSDLFSDSLYRNSQEVLKDGYYCSLLEVIDKSRSMTSVTTLLQELEVKRAVLVTPLTERGFLFLLSSVQTAMPAERGEDWKRCLQALFVFPETRDISKSKLNCSASSSDGSESSVSVRAVIKGLKQFIPALHHSLVKTRANPPPDLSAGVERQVREYLIGQKDGKVRPYPMGEYNTELDEPGKTFPAPKNHRSNLDAYLCSYLYNPALYLLSTTRMRKLVEAHGIPEELQELRSRQSRGRDGEMDPQRMQKLVDLVLTCERNAENEVLMEEGREEAPEARGRNRKRKQKMAMRTIKYLKASQELARSDRIPVDPGQTSAPPFSLDSLLGSLGLRNMDLQGDGSEPATKLFQLLTGLSQAACGHIDAQRHCEAQEDILGESCLFDRLAVKLGPPTSCDELEEQMACSASSLEGFSPSGETNHHAAAGRIGGPERRAGSYEGVEEEEWAIPWVLIPISGLCSKRYTQRDRNIPQDPRFHHFAMATDIATTTEPPRKSPALSPGHSPPPFTTQCSSPDPSPPHSPSMCPSPEPSPAPSPSHCPSLEPSPPSSPLQCRSHPPSSTPFVPDFPPVKHELPPKCHLQTPNELNPFNDDRNRGNERQSVPAAPRESTGTSNDTEPNPCREEKQNEDSSGLVSQRPPIPPTSLSSKIREQEEAGIRIDDVQDGQREPSEDRKEFQPCKKVHKGEEKEVTQKEGTGKEDAKKMEKSCFLVSLPPPSSKKDIDSIVDKHLGDFSSDMHHLLQEESVQYSFPQQFASNAQIPARQFPLTTLVTPFSQYVSFCHPCVPVTDYVNSLRTSIDNMIKEFQDPWVDIKLTSKQAETDAALANRVSAFLASMQAATGKKVIGDEAPIGEPTTIDDRVSVSPTPNVSREVDVWQQNTPNRNPRGSVNLSVSKNETVIHPPLSKSPRPDCEPQPNLTVSFNSRQTSDSSTSRVVQHSAGGSSAHSVTGVDPHVSLQGSSGASEPSDDPSLPSEQVPRSGCVPVTGSATEPAHQAVGINSLINQLHPELFSNLWKIMKDVKKNTQQFYLHLTKPDDPVSQDIKDYLLKQGYVEQNPVAFMNQELSDNRLLVVIKNKDIAGHVHKIPGLVSLKQHQSVVFVGIDTPDDIVNRSYNELFISGGCIISDDLVFSPDVVSHNQVAALLMLLEQQCSSGSLWRWKVHYKTHKKLKEQARFRRDAANLLEILSTYHKRQVVEFLPYHHCDMNHQSPDLDCLIELQARYTQYRHTLFLTEQGFGRSPINSSSGIIVACMEDILQNFTKLVGYHNTRDKQQATDEVLSSKEADLPLPSSGQVADLLQQSGSSLPHFPDQLVPEASSKDGVPRHSDSDLAILHLAISQLRAERRAQQEQQQQQQSGSQKTSQPLHIEPPSDEATPSETVRLTPGEEAAATSVELVPSGLRTATEERPVSPVKGGGEPGAEKDIQTPWNSKTSDSLRPPTPTSNFSAATTVEQCDPNTETVNNSKAKTDQQEQAAGPSNYHPIDDCRSRDALSSLEASAPRHDAAKSSGSTRPKGQGSGPVSSQPRPKPARKPPQYQPNEPLHQRMSFPQPPYSQQQWGANLMQRPRLHFAHSPQVRGIAGTSVWSRALVPAGALVWGFQQHGRDLIGPGLLGGYHSPAGQGNMGHRGRPRGGFDRM